MKKYRSKIDIAPLVLVLLYYNALFVLLLTLKFWLGVCFMLGFNAIMFFSYRSICYKIKGEELCITGSLGLPLEPIKIERIEKIERRKRKIKFKLHRQKTIGYSRDTIYIFYRNFYNEEGYQIISPKEKEELIAELLKINPNIQVISEKSIKK